MDGHLTDITGWTINRHWTDNKQTQDDNWKDNKWTLNRHWTDPKQTLDRHENNIGRTINRHWMDTNKTPGGHKHYKTYNLRSQLMTY